MNVFPLILLALLGSVAGLIGGVLFLIKDVWAKKLCGVAVPFAAGVLITVSLLDLLPEAVEIGGEGAFSIVLFSFLAAYLFENLVLHLLPPLKKRRLHFCVRECVPRGDGDVKPSFQKGRRPKKKRELC